MLISDLLFKIAEKTKVSIRFNFLYGNEEILFEILFMMVMVARGFIELDFSV